VIDRSILRQQVGDRKIYFAQEVEIEGAAWVTVGGQRREDACAGRGGAAQGEAL
jgi:hypothetical protein